MSNKTKPFDCVEMKRQAQEALRLEYERRKSDFSSYADFIRATADEVDEIRRWREKSRLSIKQ